MENREGMTLLGDLKKIPSAGNAEGINLLKT
jgi:hypothetical protein